MKKELYTRLFGLAVLMLLPSCVKDTIYNTPHPDKGALVIHLPEELVGESHVVKINERSYELVSVPFVCPDMLPAGNHTIILHNRADGFVFDGFVARIGDVTNKSRANGAPMNPVPDYLRTVSQEVAIVADDTLRVTPVPVQRVRDLHIELEVTHGRPELIQSVTATLDGVAGAFDMATEQTVGDPCSTVFSFGRENNKLTADLRLLGTMGVSQKLSLDVVFVDGGRTQYTETDLTEALKNFNGDMTTTYRVLGTLETPVGMETGNAEIIGWEDTDNGEVEAVL